MEAGEEAALPRTGPSYLSEGVGGGRSRRLAERRLRESSSLIDKNRRQGSGSGYKIQDGEKNQGNVKLKVTHCPEHKQLGSFQTLYLDYKCSKNHQFQKQQWLIPGGVQPTRPVHSTELPHGLSWNLSWQRDSTSSSPCWPAVEETKHRDSRPAVKLTFYTKPGEWPLLFWWAERSQAYLLSQPTTLCSPHAAREARGGPATRFSGLPVRQ